MTQLNFKHNRKRLLCFVVKAKWMYDDVFHSRLLVLHKPKANLVTLTFDDVSL